MADRIDLRIDQGSVFAAAIDIVGPDDEPVNLVEYSGKSQMRPHYASNTYYEFDVSLTSSGTIVLKMDDEYTANIEPGRYVYDVLLTSGGESHRVAEGTVTVTSNVTR